MDNVLKQKQNILNGQYFKTKYFIFKCFVSSFKYFIIQMFCSSLKYFKKIKESS